VIFINKNTSQNVVLTLKEKATLTGGTSYLFGFKNSDTNITKYFTAPNVSTAQTRYDCFSITETGSTFQNLTGGTVNLTEGYYDYSIFQQNSATNISPSFSGVTTLVETGKVLVSGSVETIIFDDDDAEQTYIIDGE
tara:strand:+ start:860 stop:1270 length:411 start_codon:yes stop_codon:yes gene_type:complete